MELTRWIDTLIVELPKLLSSLQSNTYPASFLQNALGLSPEQAAALPRYTAIFVALYLLCGLITIALRFTKKQKSLNRTAQQITNAILMICCTLFIPALIFLAKGAILFSKQKWRPTRAFMI